MRCVAGSYCVRAAHETDDRASPRRRRASGVSAFGAVIHALQCGYCSSGGPVLEAAARRPTLRSVGGVSTKRVGEPKVTAFWLPIARCSVAIGGERQTGMGLVYWDEPSTAKTSSGAFSLVPPLSTRRTTSTCPHTPLTFFVVSVLLGEHAGVTTSLTLSHARSRARVDYCPTIWVLTDIRQILLWHKVGQSCATMPAQNFTFWLTFC